jgi:non-ribosomal peptide synthase protein (TIGR01720 family)
VLETNAAIVAGRLRVNWSYSDTLHNRSTIEATAAAFEKALIKLIEHCQSTEAGGFTPSDFPEVELSQEELDRFLDGISDE